MSNSRSGVVVSYDPEDTMKSVVFNQFNKHTLQSEDRTNLYKYLTHQSELEKALEYLSSDSESAASSMTRSTVKEAASNSYSSLNEKVDKNSNSQPNNNDYSSKSTNNHFAEVENQVLSPYHKPFEDIIQEKLKEEPPSTRNVALRRTVSDSRPNRKFTFLRKNSGKSAWSSNLNKQKIAEHITNGSKLRGQSLTDEKRSTFQTDINSPPKKKPANKKESTQSLINMTNENRENIMTTKQNKPISKNVHFAKSDIMISSIDSNCLSNRNLDGANEFDSRTCVDLDDEIQELSKNQIPPTIYPSNSSGPSSNSSNIGPKLMTSREEKELKEFEILEQMANDDISVNSSTMGAIVHKLDMSSTNPERRYGDNGVARCCTPPDLRQVADLYNFGNRQSSLPISQKKISEEQAAYLTHNSDILYGSNTYTGSGPDDTNVTTTSLSEYNDDQDDDEHEGDADEEENAEQEEQPKQNYESDQPDVISELKAKMKRKVAISSAMKNSGNWLEESPFCMVDAKQEEDEDEDDWNEEDNDESGLGNIFPKINDQASQMTQIQTNNEMTSQSVKLKQWTNLLDAEIRRFKKENQEIAQLKVQKEQGLKELEKEMENFRVYRADEERKFEEYKQTERKKLKKDRKVLEEYEEAVKTAGRKKDRQEFEKVQLELETVREEMRSKETRWNNEKKRLNLRIEDLEKDNGEMRERVHNLEQKRLQLQTQLLSSNKLASSTKIKPNISAPKTVTSVSQAISQKHRTNLPIPNKQAQQQPGPKEESHTNNSNNNNNNNMRNSTTASDYYTGEEEDEHQQQKFEKNITKRKNNNPTGQSINQLKPRTNNHIQVSPMPPNQNPGPNTNYRSFPGVLPITIDPNDPVKSEIVDPDGIRERIYMSGSVEVLYPNGSRKQISKDGKTTVVYLYNGDIKLSCPDGKVTYFYCHDGSMQTTLPDGTEEIQYENGQKEVHYNSGVTEIHYTKPTNGMTTVSMDTNVTTPPLPRQPDPGIVTLISPQQQQQHPLHGAGVVHQQILPNGMIEKLFQNGDKEIELHNGQREWHFCATGVKRRLYPDGTTKTVYPDGKQETRYSSGRLRVKDKAGNLLLDIMES